MIPNFLYIIIIIIILFFFDPLISHLAAKPPSQVFFNISKENLIKILLCGGDFLKDRK